MYRGPADVWSGHDIRRSPFDTVTRFVQSIKASTFEDPYTWFTVGYNLTASHRPLRLQVEMKTLPLRLAFLFVVLLFALSAVPALALGD